MYACVCIMLFSFQFHNTISYSAFVLKPMLSIVSYVYTLTISPSPSYLWSIKVIIMYIVLMLSAHIILLTYQLHPKFIGQMLSHSVKRFNGECTKIQLPNF